MSHCHGDTGPSSYEYRQAQARRLVHCFEKHEGRPPNNEAELKAWATNNVDKLPFDERNEVKPLWWHPDGNGGSRRPEPTA